MNQRVFLVVLICLSSIHELHAQRSYPAVSQDTALKILEKSKLSFPKFYKAITTLQAQDSVVKEIIFIQEKSVGPGFASPKGTITFNLHYLSDPKTNHDDNRLLVVLHHEQGHLHYYKNIDRAKWSPEESEKAAFEYSLIKVRELAQKGDCAPLTVGLKYMKLRSQSNELKDPHIRALKRLVNERFYTDLVHYSQNDCK